MVRSKAKQLELEKAQAQRGVDFHFENMMWKHYAAEDITNEGGLDRLETDYYSVFNTGYKPTLEGLNNSVVSHAHNYLEALEALGKL